MSKLSDWIDGGAHNMNEMSYEEQVGECLYRSDNSKRYEEAQSWRELATVYAIMHLADVMKGGTSNA